MNRVLGDEQFKNISEDKTRSFLLISLPIHLDFSIYLDMFNVKSHYFSIKTASCIIGNMITHHAEISNH